MQICEVCDILSPSKTWAPDYKSQKHEKVVWFFASPK